MEGSVMATLVVAIMDINTKKLPDTHQPIGELSIVFDLYSFVSELISPFQ